MATSPKPEVNQQDQFFVGAPPLRPSPTTLDSPNEDVSSHTIEFNLKFSILDAVFILGGMITYVVDIVTDIIVAVQYFFDEDYMYAIMTFAFFVVPSITLQYFSLRWFITDKQEEESHKKKSNISKLLSWIKWLLIHLFQLGVIQRYWRTLKYGWKSRNKSDEMKERQRNYKKMVYEDRDTCMLSLLEAFMESAPELVLQLYIIKKQHDDLRDVHWMTGISALASLFSLTWSLEAYHKALRESCQDKRNIGYLGFTFRMMWRLFTISSRVISFALFASIYKWVIFPIVGFHWLVMTTWLIYQKTNFCSTALEEVFFDAIMGIVYIFTFFTMKEGRSRYRALLFYVIVFIEDTVLFALWYYSDDSMYTAEWFSVPAFMLVWGCYFTGIFFMMSYYCCLHPNIEYPCHKKSVYDKVVNSSEKADMSTVRVSTPRNQHEGNLFTREGRRSLHLYRNIENANLPN